MKPQTCAQLLRRLTRARNFPLNTCSATRHAEIIGRKLLTKRGYPMLLDEPEHCAGSILSAVTSAYECRTALRTLREVCLRMEAERSADRPSEAVYQHALRNAARALGDES